MGQVNIRVADGQVESVRRRLKEVARQMGISQGDVLEKGLESLQGSGGEVRAGDGLSQKIYERAGRIENMVEELLGMGGSVKIPPDGMAATILDHVVYAGGEAPAVDSRPKNATCKHCGEVFAGARFATICPGCKSTGHTLMPTECPVCGEGLSI